MKTNTPCALAELPAGCRARVARINGAGDIRARLSAMGLTPDTAIEVLECLGGRQLIKVRGCNLILDGDTACKITCSRDECQKGRGRWAGFMRRFRRRGKA